MGCVAEQFLPALTRHHSTISSKLRQGSFQIRLHTRTADCRCMSRFGLIARTDCLPSTAGPAGLSRGSNHAQQRESISRWLDVTAQPGDTSYRHLHRAHKGRRRQSSSGRGRGRLPGPIEIWPRRQQPVAGRTRFGDWRANLVCAAEARRPCSVARRTRAAFCCRPRPKTRRPPLSKRHLLRVLCELPPNLRQPLILDNDWELAGFRKLEREDLRTSFCRPYSPWQRGTNENSKGLLRQYFLKDASA